MQEAWPCGEAHRIAAPRTFATYVAAGVLQKRRQKENAATKLPILARENAMRTYWPPCLRSCRLILADMDLGA